MTSPIELCSPNKWAKRRNKRLMTTTTRSRVCFYLTFSFTQTVGPRPLGFNGSHTCFLTYRQSSPFGLIGSHTSFLSPPPDRRLRLLRLRREERRLEDLRLFPVPCIISSFPASRKGRWLIFSTKSNLSSSFLSFWVRLCFPSNCFSRLFPFPPD